MAQTSPQQRRNPFANPSAETTPRRSQRPNNLYHNYLRDPGDMNPPSPTRTPPYRQGTPPPASFHSPTHHSPVHSSPTYIQTSVPPVPSISSVRRGPAHFASAAIAQNKAAAASPFTQISASYQETMQQIDRSGGALTFSSPNIDTPLERRNSGSSKRSSISPRTSVNNSTATSLAEQLKAFELVKAAGTTPPPRLHSPRVQSPLHESHSPKRRTPDRSLPLNEEEHEEQERRVDSQPELEVESSDTKSPNEDVDATIKPTRRSSVVERSSPAKASLAQSKSRERIQERYQRSLEAAMQETPVQRIDRLLHSDEEEEDDDEKTDYVNEMNGRESRAGHREEELDLGEAPDPTGGTLRTIPEAQDAEEELEVVQQDDQEEEETDGHITPKSPTSKLMESPIMSEAVQVAAHQILAQLFPNSARLHQLRMAESSQQRDRRDSTTSNTSQRPPMPVRHHIPEVAVPTASQHWSPDMAFDPRDVNKLLQELQRNISPLAQSRYTRVNSQHPHPLQNSFGLQGNQQESGPPQVEPSLADVLSADPREAMMIGTPSTVPDDVIQSLMGEHGYYGFTMGMVSPSPSTSIDPNLMTAQSVAGNSLSAMANAIASSSGIVSPPQTVQSNNMLHHPSNNTHNAHNSADKGKRRAPQEIQSEVTNEHERERPGAPIPPTPYTSQNSISATTPGMPPAPLLPSDANNVANIPIHHALLSPQTHPAPYGYMRRHQTFPIQPQHTPQFMRGASYPQQYQYQNFQGGPVLTDSTFSPASTPYPHPVYPYNPFIQQNLQAARAGERSNIPIPSHLLETMSMRSSPSHLPVLLPPEGSGPRRLKRRTKLNNQQQNHVDQTAVEDDQGFSTEPHETSPEHTEAGEATDFGQLLNPQVHVEEQPLIDLLNDREDQSTPVGIAIGGEEDEEDEWIDEDDEGEGDLLGLEYHPSYITKMERRKRNWEKNWEVMKEAFQAIDRETDSTMLLLAAPSHTNTLHTLSSRALRRSPALMLSSEISNVRSNFSKVAASRRSSRARTASLLERLRGQNGSVGSTPTGEVSEQREDELRTALEGALGSLSQLGKMYHDLQTRWQAEMVRLGEERESIQLLLQQAFGAGVASTLHNYQ